MNFKTIYECEKCGWESFDRNSIEEHEKSHINTQSYILRELSTYFRESKYPFRIAIEMEDGKIVAYDRAEEPEQKEALSPQED